MDTFIFQRFSQIGQHISLGGLFNNLQTRAGVAGQNK
jgi:hypothetical protein